MKASIILAFCVHYSSCITSTGLFAPSITFLVILVSPITGEVTLLLAIIMRSYSYFQTGPIFHQLVFFLLAFYMILDSWLLILCIALSSLPSSVLRVPLL